MPKAPSFTGIKETCLYVADLHATYHFYHRQLGLACISFVAGRHVFFTAGHSMLLCFNAAATRQEEKLPPHWGEGHLHFAFSCQREDFSRWKQHLKAADIVVEAIIDWPGGFQSMYFRDPDQHCVEIVMEGMWEYGRP